MMSFSSCHAVGLCTNERTSAVIKSDINKHNTNYFFYDNVTSHLLGDHLVPKGLTEQYFFVTQ